MKLTVDQKRQLKALLDCAIPECRPVTEFLRNLEQYGTGVAIARFERRKIHNQIYWEYAKEYLQQLEGANR
jgi:hypothetical protein